MECRIHRPVDRDTVEVFLFEDRGGDRIAHRVKEGTDLWEMVVVPEMEPMPVSMRFRPEAFSALIAAGMDFEPPSSAVSNHLKDALAVRDRALGMVERIVDADLAREAARG